jgi:hypothetical protein
MRAARIPFLVGEGYALAAYTGIARATKDLDLFVLPADVSERWMPARQPDRSKVPERLLKEFVRRLGVEMNSAPTAERWCQGTRLSWAQYLPDIYERGYQDARHFPKGNLSKEQTAAVTDIFQRGEH